MMIKFTTPTLPGLNEYINAERTNRYKAAKLKKDTERMIMLCTPMIKITKPVTIHYKWVEKDRRRDKDNISFAKKFVQDALVKKGVLKNDGWKEIVNSYDEFEVDPKNPRVEITIKEQTWHLTK